jgi:hypothetical protein
MGRFGLSGDIAFQPIVTLSGKTHHKTQSFITQIPSSLHIFKVAKNPGWRLRVLHCKSELGACDFSIHKNCVLKKSIQTKLYVNWE